jgi:hypothetical protein
LAAVKKGHTGEESLPYKALRGCYEGLLNECWLSIDSYDYYYQIYT